MQHCLICFRPLDEGLTLHEYLFGNDVICGNCRQHFHENTKIYTYQYIRVHAFYEYDDFLESLLYQFKEGKDIALAKAFLWKKKEEMNDIFRHHQCICMPSSHEKIQSRGFHHLHEMLSCTCVTDANCLEKTKNYKQSLQRAQNRRKVHEVIKLVQIPTQKFFLFDDVVTSGNTLLAAAALLRRNEEIIDAYAFSVHPHFVEICDKQQL